MTGLLDTQHCGNESCLIYHIIDTDPYNNKDTM